MLQELEAKTPALSELQPVEELQAAASATVAQATEVVEAGASQAQAASQAANAAAAEAAVAGGSPSAAGGGVATPGGASTAVGAQRSVSEVAVQTTVSGSSGVKGGRGKKGRRGKGRGGKGKLTPKAGESGDGEEEEEVVLDADGKPIAVKKKKKKAKPAYATPQSWKTFIVRTLLHPCCCCWYSHTHALLCLQRTAPKADSVRPWTLPRFRQTILECYFEKLRFDALAMEDEGTTEVASIAPFVCEYLVNLHHHHHRCMLCFATVLFSNFVSMTMLQCARRIRAHTV